jgi:hypothetical protein
LKKYKFLSSQKNFPVKNSSKTGHQSSSEQLKMRPKHQHHHLRVKMKKPHSSVERRNARERNRGTVEWRDGDIQGKMEIFIFKLFYHIYFYFVF